MPYSMSCGVTICTTVKSDPDKMHPGPLADRVRYWKKSEEGVRKMCQIIEDMRREERQRGIEQGLLDSIRSLMETTQYSVQEILGLLKVPKADQPRYLAML